MTEQADITENVLIKTIGRKTYRAYIHFSKSSKENLNDKLLRVIKNDIKGGQLLCQEKQTKKD